MGGKFLKVDYCTITFLDSDYDYVCAGIRHHDFTTELTNKGHTGFAHHYKIYHHTVFCGIYAFGGTAMRGRSMISITGIGFQNKKSIDLLVHLLSNLPEVRITRFDIALDIFEGFSMEDAVKAYRDGEFATGGRRPSHSIVGDWLDPASPEGRTLYVGKSLNGKLVRVYEKGKQMGDPKSSWVRVELQLGSRDREIPHDIFHNMEGVFCAECPLVQRLLSSQHFYKIPTASIARTMSVRKLVKYAQIAYGKLFFTLFNEYSLTKSDVFNILQIPGQPSSLAGLFPGADFSEDELEGSLDYENAI